MTTQLTTLKFNFVTTEASVTTNQNQSFSKAQDHYQSNDTKSVTSLNTILDSSERDYAIATLTFFEFKMQNARIQK